MFAPEATLPLVGSGAQQPRSRKCARPPAQRDNVHTYGCTWLHVGLKSHREMPLNRPRSAQPGSTRLAALFAEVGHVERSEFIQEQAAFGVGEVALAASLTTGGVLGFPAEPRPVN